MENKCLIWRLESHVVSTDFAIKARWNCYLLFILAHGALRQGILEDAEVQKTGQNSKKTTVSVRLIKAEKAKYLPEM